MSLSSPSSTSLSARRAFIPAPLASKSLIASTPIITTSTISSPNNNNTTTTSTTTNTLSVESKRHSQVLLEDALPTQRLPIVSTPQHRSISAYFSDYSLECGAASPYISEPVCVLPNLYLGAEHNATNVRVLKRLGITFVLNVAIEIAKQEGSTTTTMTQLDTSAAEEATRGSIEFKSLAWTHHQKDLLRDFPAAFAMIDAALAANHGQGKALIHCQLGVSRSASLVIAYVMRARGMGLTEAYDFVKQRSGVISPNMSLMYQLAEFEKGLKKQGDGFFTSDHFSTLAQSNRDSWCSQMGDDDEPPYPFSAAFSAAAATPTTTPSVSSFDMMTSMPEIMIMDEPATPSRSEFYKRPLTPESSRMEDHPSTKPFQGSNRSSLSSRANLPASRRLSLTSTPQHSKFSPRSPLTRGPPTGLSLASSSSNEGSLATPRSFLLPKTPIRDRFPSMTLPMSGDIEMMVPPTPLFQSSFSIPSLTSSSSSSSSASSVSSFEACSRPSISSTVSSSSYFTACDEDDELNIEFGYDAISPRNSGSWSHYPSAASAASAAISGGSLTWPSMAPSLSSSSSASSSLASTPTSSPSQLPTMTSRPLESLPSLQQQDEPVKKKSSKKAMWSGLKVLQVVTEASSSSSSLSSSASASATSLYSYDLLEDPSTVQLPTAPAPTVAAASAPMPTTATTPTTPATAMLPPPISTTPTTAAASSAAATSTIMSKQAPDFIFSPRPYTPTRLHHHRNHHEPRTFGDFYQALCMEG
ncbi:hypothetical protein BGW39_007014 [Mortierella sp. 14UC]|nr:hypothetical protein BGW39_007014 [Mortierella sp. 14UC]